MAKPVSNPLGLAVLAYLLERPMHPYELGKLLKQRNLQASIKYRHASLYMVVDQLSRNGYIQATGTTRDGQRPERTVYRLTDDGRRELHARMRELVAVPAQEYPAFSAALALLAVLPPTEAVELLRQRRRALAGEAARLREHLAQRQHIDQLWLVEHDYRRELVEAEERFVERLVRQIEEHGPSFGAYWRTLHADDQS